MKKILLAIMVLMIALPAAAQRPYGGHVWYLTNLNEALGGPGEECEYLGTARHFVNVWLVPGPNGAHGAEYRFLMADGTQDEMFVSRIVKNTLVGDALIGDWSGPPGISMGFLACITTLFWVVELRIEGYGFPGPGYYEIVGHDDTGEQVVPICEGARPLELTKSYIKYGYNTACVRDEAISTEDSSWGAIKSMMK